MFLTDSELADLTGKIQHSAQLRALRFMGVNHRVRPDGSIAVLKSHVAELLGVDSRATVGKDPEPNWQAL